MLKEIEGKTLVKITGLRTESDAVKFHFTDGSVMTMEHQQDCCEYVSLCDFEDDIVGIEGATIITADEVTNEGAGEILEMLGAESAADREKDAESFTWTFYIINTDRGSLWLRWFGESNGYYSESVDCEWTTHAPQTLTFH